MRKAAAPVLVLCFALVALAQSTKWEREDKTDPLRGTSYAQFMITGKFLTPPKNAPEGDPIFVVKCLPGNRRHVSGGYTNGKLMDAFISLRAVLDRSRKGDVFVQYRLDDGKMHKEWWGAGTDDREIFPPEIELNTVLYGHFLTHKEGTSDPVHKLVLGVNEHRGDEIVVQFDLPDPTEMADACGLLIRKN